jgi:hypothetical protein
MINIFTTKGSYYDDIMAAHAESLRNLEMFGIFKTNKELMAWNGPNRPEPIAMEIHDVYPTIFLYNNQIHYTTVVCYEPKAIEEVEEKKEGAY